MSEMEKDSLKLDETDTREAKVQEEEALQQMVEVEVRGGSSSEAFQTLLSRVGDYGPWQWRMFFITGFGGIFAALAAISAVFVAATPEHWCSVPGLQDLNTTQDLRNISIPWLDDGDGRGKYSSCSYYDRAWPALVGSGALDDHTLPHLPSNLSTKACHQWVYDHSVYKTTIVEEWGLVCRNKYLVSIVQSTFMGGILAGSLFSELADRFGRRTISLISMMGFIVTSVCVIFANSYVCFIVLRFFVATFAFGFFLPNFVILSEVVGTKGRTVMCMFYQGFFSIGFTILAIIAYFVREWRYLQLCITVPSVLLLLNYWILPESPRWLMLKGRHQEGFKILRQVAKVNGGSLPQQQEIDAFLGMIRKERGQSRPVQTTVLRRVFNFIKSIMTLLRTRNMRRRCLIMFFTWFVVSMVYYGLAFSGGNINASAYVLVSLAGVVEVLSYFLVCWTVKMFGRRVNLCVLCIICGVACLLIMAVPKELVWLNITLATVGKFFNAAAFAVAYIYSAELVPTGIRNVALGTSSVCARLGSALAPFIVDLLGEIHYTVPSTVFGLLSVAAGLLALLLPETGKTRLPETMEEVEAMPR